MQNNVMTNPRHEHVTMTTPEGVDIDVDVKMAELLTTLWAIGVTTNYSCQGEPTDFSWEDESPESEKPGWNASRDRRAYISMENSFESSLLVSSLVAGFPKLGFTDNSMWAFEFDYHPDQGPRICIRFPHNEIPHFVSFLRD